MAAVNRAAHPEPVGRNPNGGVPSSGQHEPGPLGAAQEPGFPSHPQHPMFGRPVVYVPPPPPPLFHYPWSMPFSYSPFAGFPGLGYGMIVPPPPFPPPPYMDAGGYILPHPPVHPVDYRRLPHPLAHTQGPSHPNPVQTRRIRPTHVLPVREMVNSEVQTEPVHGVRGSFHLGSDSGRGTCSNSPEGAEGKSPYREGTELTDPTGFPKQPVGSNASQQCGSTGPERPRKDLPDQDHLPDSFSKDGDLWLSSSPVRAAPVPSSSQKDDVFLKERPVVPDTLMNWGGGMPQTHLLKKNGSDKQPSPKHDVQPPSCGSTDTNEVDTGPTGGTESQVSEGLFRILRLPHSTIDAFLESTSNDPGEEGFLRRHSLTFRDEVKHLQNSSHNVSTEVQETDAGSYLQELSDVAVSAGSCKPRQKLNVSVWSVESLPPYIPSREWLLQSGVLGPEVCEMTEEGLCNRKDLLEGKVCSSFNMCSSIQEKEQSPGREKRTGPEEVHEPVGSEPSRSETPSENDVCSSSCGPLAEAPPAPAGKDGDEKRSSEPEAGCSPNQKSLILGELQQNSLPSSEELSSASETPAPSAVQLTSQSGADTEDGAPTMLQNTEALPSKGALVDCGVQCNEYDSRCFCKELLTGMETNHRHPHRFTDIRRTNDGRNGHAKKKNHWRSSAQDRQSTQQDAHSGHCRDGKPKGGRNQRHH